MNIKNVCNNSILLLLIVSGLAFAKTSASAPDFDNGKWINNLTYKSGAILWFNSAYTERVLQIFTRTDPNKNGVWARATLTKDSKEPTVQGETSTSLYREVKALKLTAKQYKGLLMLVAKMPAEWPASVARATDCDYIMADHGGYEHVSFQGHTQSLVSYDYSGYCRGQNELISPVMESLSAKLSLIKDNVFESGVWIE